ncbi:hypothetical protein MNB_SM-6-719 [hydrothermal vent metagenome]|uniref:DUF523 domain-containing protein n=1 Tax=hydrothermal vent metagenome TaxID=652676 RepID=A0A1W1BL67_9ZZZZ
MEIEGFLEQNPNFERIILKSKSPSCGYRTTSVLSETKEQLYLGSGIAATMIAEKFPNIAIESEFDFL